MTTLHLLLHFCFLPSVLSTVMESTCPKFQQGWNKITCKINLTAIDDEACDSLQNKVTFEKGYTRLCYAPPPAASGCSTSSNTSTNPCWCVESDNIFTYTFLYVAALSDVGATVECKYCVPSPNTNDIVGCKISSFDSENQASRADMIYTTLTWHLPVFLSFNFYGLGK